MTVEEYLEPERATVEKHEFIDGEIVEMADESLRHSIIIVNIGSALRAQLRGSGCVTFGPDVCIARGQMIADPDVTVVCGEPDFLDQPYFVEHNRRMEDGTWQIIMFPEADSIIRLNSIGVDLPVDAIYEDTERY